CIYLTNGASGLTAVADSSMLRLPTKQLRRSPMTTLDFITELFCRVSDRSGNVPKHPLSKLHPSELITIGLLFALKGVGPRAFYRWLTRDWRSCFPNLPERTRLFRLLTVHHAWTNRFVADPTVL